MGRYETKEAATRKQVDSLKGLNAQRSTPIVRGRLVNKSNFFKGLAKKVGINIRGDYR